jgi:REP element-mobilizing transposase RayT
MQTRFGSIEDGEARLNDAGAMVADCWLSNVSRYPSAALDQFVVMPNHMHAIVFLGTDPGLPERGASLSRIVQSFKSITTVEYAKGVRLGTFPPFERVLWQRGFHDKIIRNDRALEAARLYIEGNPGQMQEQRDSSS